VSLLLSHTQGYCYHLSKFHIYALTTAIEKQTRTFQLFDDIAKTVLMVGNFGLILG